MISSGLLNVLTGRFPECREDVAVDEVAVLGLGGGFQILSRPPKLDPVPQQGGSIARVAPCLPPDLCFLLLSPGQGGLLSLEP
jgi:hypothetical protein